MVRPRSDLVSAFRDHWRRYFAPAGRSTQIVAVSGGIDSMVLLALLLRERVAGPDVDIVAAHYDHGLRGEAGAEDGRFVSEVASSWGGRAVTGSGDVGSVARERGSGPQAAARDLRYAFLARLAREEGAAGVITAHQRNDVAETVLLRMVRGASPAGLSGPRPIDRVAGVWVSRPLLPFSRPDIERWAEASGVPFRADPSNADPKYPRTRIREEVIPLLAEINPRVVDAIVRLSTLAGTDTAWLEEVASRRSSEATVSRTESCWALDAAAVMDLPAAILGRVVLLGWAWAAEPAAPAPSGEWVAGVASFVQGGRGGEISIPGGGIVRRKGSKVEFHRPERRESRG